MLQNKIKCNTSRDGRTAYVSLPGYPTRKKDRVGCAVRTLDLHGIVPDYRGPSIALDFDQQGRLIGIEILVLGENDF